jgi:hypothetical protein
MSKLYQDIYDPQLQVTECVGSFTSVDKDHDFKACVKDTYEHFMHGLNVDPYSNMKTILMNEGYYAQFKDMLYGDVTEASQPTSYGAFGQNAANGQNDEYVALHADKLERLLENTRQVILQESSTAGVLEPIVGLTMPLLKKEYITNQFKDMLQVMVAPKPIIRYAYERRFMKNENGDKMYFPECFYDGSYAEFTDATIGKPISSEWYPKTGSLPLVDLNMLEESGGSLKTRDALGYDFCIDAVKLDVANDTATEEVIIEGVNLKPDYASRTFRQEIPVKSKKTGDDTVYNVQIFGMVDFYSGVVTVTAVSSDATVITPTGIRFGGHLSNANNDIVVEFDKERHNEQITIAEKERFNIGLTLEKIQDEKALTNSDVTSELVADMADICSQTADSNTQRMLENSFNKTKVIQTTRIFQPMGYTFKFADEYEFDLSAPSTYMIPESQWRSDQLRYYFGRVISYLKTKLHDERVMFAISANSFVIEMLSATTTNGVRWVLDSGSNIGGVKLDYKFGVMTVDGTRLHIVATQKETIEKGFRIVAIPLTDTVITYRKYEYSFNIETNYRNKLTPNTPNIMGVQRYEFLEVLPFQSCLFIKQYREGNFGFMPSDIYPVSGL